MLKSFASFTRMVFFKSIATDKVFFTVPFFFTFHFLSAVLLWDCNISICRWMAVSGLVTTSVTSVTDSIALVTFPFTNFWMPALQGGVEVLDMLEKPTGESYLDEIAPTLLFAILERTRRERCQFGTSKGGAHPPALLLLLLILFLLVIQCRKMKQVKQVQEVKQVREVKQVKQEGKQVQVKVARKKCKWKPRGRNETSKKIETSETRPPKSHVKVKWKKRKESSETTAGKVRRKKCT